MNIKVCRKCKGTENVFFYNTYEGRTSTRGHEITNTIGVGFNNQVNTCHCIHFNYKKEAMSVIKKRNAYIAKFMEVSKDCPYYAEHQLNEWNKK